MKAKTKEYIFNCVNKGLKFCGYKQKTKKEINELAAMYIKCDTEDAFPFDENNELHVGGLIARLSSSFILKEIDIMSLDKLKKEINQKIETFITDEICWR